MIDRVSETTEFRYEDAIDMMDLLKNLGPLTRTLACAATDKAYELIGGLVPEAEIDSAPCGSKAWTWTIPKRWELDGGFIRTGGEKIS